MDSPVWFFDLDNTLHDASYRIFSTINGTMNAYVMQHLQVDDVEAGRLRVDYWKRYGATLLGLVRHHAIDAHHFLNETHSFCESPGFAEMVRAERGLAGLLRRLPGRKVLLTNAPARYAHQVLVHIGLHRHFTRRYSIEHMRIHGRFKPKPSATMMRALLARERVPAARAVLVEDSLENLRGARSVGMRTVHVRGMLPPGQGKKSARRLSYVDLRIESVMQLSRCRRFLR
jgi:putative hydrolase of the HAD superfamily